MRKLFLYLAILASIFFTSCATRLGTFTVISTKNIEWSRANEYQRNGNRVLGEDVYHIVVFIPTKGNITIEDAVDNALGKVPGAVALVDVVLRSQSFYIPYVYGKNAFIVEGSVLIDPKLVANDDSNEIIYYQGYYDKNKEFKLSKIEKTQFNSIQKDIAQKALN